MVVGVHLLQNTHYPIHAGNGLLGRERAKECHQHRHSTFSTFYIEGRPLLILNILARLIKIKCSSRWTVRFHLEGLSVFANDEGTTEYWLENVDLFNIRKEGFAPSVCRISISGDESRAEKK